MYCKNCGTNIPDSALFCNKCGTPIGNAPSAVNNTPQKDSTNAAAAYNPVNNPVYTPSYNPVGGTPVYQPTQPQPAEKKSKTGLIIAIIAVAAVLIIGIAIALTVFSGNGNFSLTSGKEETTTATETETVMPELINDPISYFIQQPDGYYKLTTDSNADFYIYPEYGSTDHYPTRFAGNELIFVYGTYNGWACFEYKDSTNGYAWCKTASIYKTDETPTEAEPATVYVPTPAPEQPSYSPVYTDSYYKVSGTGSAGLNLRSAPNTSAPVYVVLQESELVYVHETNGTWAYVSTVDYRTGNNYEGWCATQYLSYAY